MRTTVQRHAIFLAALLQVLPIVRNFFINPATTSSFAFILRWGVGTAATVGAYDACSGATVPYFTNPTNFTGTVGTYFTNNIVVTNVPGDPGAYFNLFCTNFLVSVTHISNSIVTTNCMPPGLTFKCIEKSGNSYYIGSIYGIPTSPITNWFIHFQAGYPNKTPVDVTNYFTFNLANSISPPIITNQPVIGATNLVGTTNNSFSVIAGTAPLNYQWYFNTNTAVSGATNATLTLTNIQLANSGYYRCNITNSAGATNSANALLTVWQPPIITINPVGVTNVAGANANFTVTVSGVPALNYQWRLNPATPQPGATSATLSLSSLRTSQSGSYSVVITNFAGAITSTPAALLVTNPLPTIATVPVINGANFQFTFAGIPGLTNTVLTNVDLATGTWGVYTNIPPPANNSPITIINPPGQPNLFFRVLVTP